VVVGSCTFVSVSSARPHTVTVRAAAGHPAVVAVADGLGGHEAGEVAAAHVVSGLARMPAPGLASAEQIAASLGAMSGELAAAVRDHPERRDMGTTVVGLSLAPERVIWFNIGDSRAYKLADGYLGQMSVDDTPAALLAEPGESPEPTSIVTQSIGPATPAPVAHTGIEPAVANGIYLLCSDGLSDLVGVTEIERLLARHAKDDPTAVKALWAAAMNAGGRDNITIVLVRLTPVPGAAADRIAGTAVPAAGTVALCLFWCAGAAPRCPSA
jgi:serine/threonine protein phosphatase PrpC